LDPRNPEKSEIPEFPGPPENRKTDKKVQKTPPLKRLTMKKWVSKKRVEKRPPLKELTMQKWVYLHLVTKKGPKNTPAKTTYDEKVGVLSATPVLGPKNPPAKTG